MTDIDESWKASAPFEPSEGFDFGAIDDRKRVFVSELLAHTGDLDEALKSCAAEQFQNFGSMLVIRFLAIVCQSRNPRLSCKVISWAAGLTEETLNDIAKSEGITKQAVQQMAEKYIHDLGLPKTPAMRTDEACESMAKSYKARAKH